MPTHPVEGTSPITACRRRGWQKLVAATFLALGPASASADELVLTLQPEKTSVTFRVRAPILIFFLRVAPVAAVTVKAEGNLRPDSLARHPVSAP